MRRFFSMFRRTERTVPKVWMPKNVEVSMVNTDDIKKIAKLAKLSVDEDEIEELTKDMQEIILFADTINLAMEGEGIEFDDINNIVNAFHEDVVIESYAREEILKNKNGGENGYFLVKRQSVK